MELLVKLSIVTSVSVCQSLVMNTHDLKVVTLMDDKSIQGCDISYREWLMVLRCEDHQNDRMIVLQDLSGND